MNIEHTFNTILDYYPDGMDSILCQIQAFIDSEKIKRQILGKYILFYMPYEFLVINKDTFEYKSFKNEDEAFLYCVDNK